MRTVSFLIFLALSITIAYAGPDDRWVYVGSQTDGIALLLAVGAFAWAWMIYKDARGGRKHR